MGANTFGTILTITTFGESHGAAIGGVIDGFPSGFHIDIEKVRSELNRRKTNTYKGASQRQESDEVEFVSGLQDNITLGTPIAFLIRNTDSKSADYYGFENIFRPSHADYTYQQKFGIRSVMGGGRASARETVSRVVAGALAKQYLEQQGIVICAYVSRIGEAFMKNTPNIIEAQTIESDSLRCPDPAVSQAMKIEIDNAQQQGDTVGGCIHTTISGLKAGLGDPVFDKFQAMLAHAMFSINAVKGFEYGGGFAMASMRGSACNDAFYNNNGIIRTYTNFSGGIQGGITNGEEIYFNVAFKPAPTLMQPQKTVDINGNEIVWKGSGRHDVCFVPRAVVVVEAMAAIVTMDFLLRNK